MENLIKDIRENIVSRFGTMTFSEMKADRFGELMALAQKDQAKRLGSIVAMQNILIVEDDDNNSELMQSLLRFHGMRSLVARNAAEAIDYCKDNTPAVIMMDIGLPDTNGLALTQMLRRMPGMDEVPVIAVSAHASERMRGLADEAGCMAFIAKPWKNKEVTDMVTKAVP